MFKLKLDIEEEEEMDIKNDFLDKLPKELQHIVKEIREKSKNNVCKKLKNDNSGAFGVVEIGKKDVKKILELIPQDKLNILINEYNTVKNRSQLYFLINRLNNYCKDIKKYVRMTKKYFPNNFVKIYKCNLCNTDNRKNQVYIEMGLGKGKTLKKTLETNISKKQFLTIAIQLYYISVVLNLKKLYHNDLKPANIMIVKSEIPIKYDSLKNSKEKITMVLPKGSYFPVIIDYDLCSFGKINQVDYPDGTFMNPIVPDFSFFTATTNKITNKYESLLKQIPEYLTTNEYKKLDEIYKYIKEQNIFNVKKTKL